MFLRFLFLAVMVYFGVLSAVMGQDNDPDPSVDEFVLVKQEPKPLNLDSVKRTIYYPDTCAKYKIQGTVLVKLLVDKQGKVLKHFVKKSPHPSFSEEVVSKVYAIRFSPAIKEENQVTKFWVTVPFKFVLK